MSFTWLEKPARVTHPLHPRSGEIPMTSLSIKSRASSHRAVLAICAVAQFMVVLDVSIVNVALPQMRHDLGLTLTAQQWVVNAYTLTFAGFLMLGGPAACSSPAWRCSPPPASSGGSPNRAPG